MKTIPETHQDLVQDESKAFLLLGTAMANGSPNSRSNIQARGGHHMKAKLGSYIKFR